MFRPIPVLLIFGLGFGNPKTGFRCGEKRTIGRPYGVVEVRTLCDLSPESISICEFKGREFHGVCQTYERPSLWRRDSSFYFNGSKRGTSKVWDSLGNVLGIQHVRDGHEVGRQESYYGPGAPESMGNYDSLGREQGLQLEWWPNGNKKSEWVALNGHYLSGTEYYPDGKPRHRVDCGRDTTTTIFGRQCAAKENWAPDGRSSGKVVDGNGEMLLFSADSAERRKGAFHEVYKDTMLFATEDFDSATAARWVDIYNRTGKPPAAKP